MSNLVQKIEQINGSEYVFSWNLGSAIDIWKDGQQQDSHFSYYLYTEKQALHMITTELIPGIRWGMHYVA